MRKRKILIFDRYYYDIISDPGRSKIKLDYRILKIFLNFIPKPDFKFFINVNDDEVFKRKKELSKKQISQLNCRYKKLAQDKDILLIDNYSKIESIKKILNLIIKI